MMDRSKTEWTWAVRSRWTTEPRRQAGIDGYWLGLPTQRGCPTIAAITSQFSGRGRDPDRQLSDRYRDLRLARMDGAPPLVSDPRSRLPTELFGVNLLSQDQTLRATGGLWSSRADLQRDL